MSILDTGGSIKTQALQGMQKAARLGLERDNANKKLEADRMNTKKATAGSGMATGAMIGGQIYGPIGAVVGGVVGGVAGYFGADLF